MLGYAFYASIFAVAASLVSRQEDLGTRASCRRRWCWSSRFVIGIQAAGEPGRRPGEGHLVRAGPLAAGHAGAPWRPGDVALWEVALAVVLMLVAIALVVRLGGRIYAGALLRTEREDEAPGGAAGRARLRPAAAADRLQSGWAPPAAGSRAAWACSWATR